MGECKNEPRVKKEIVSSCPKFLRVAFCRGDAGGETKGRPRPQGPAPEGTQPGRESAQKPREKGRGFWRKFSRREGEKMVDRGWNL